MTSPGVTFFGYDQANHLWIVLSQPDQDGRLALANFTSHWSDQALHQDCPLVLQKDDHPWIRRETCVYWRGLRLEQEALISDAIESGRIVTREPLIPALLVRIQQTALDVLAETHGARAAVRVALAAN